MKTLSYFIEIAEALDLALNTIVERIPCLADWYLPSEEENYLVVSVTCREEDCAFVKRMLAPFV